MSYVVVTALMVQLFSSTSPAYAKPVCAVLPLGILQSTNTPYAYALLFELLVRPLAVELTITLVAVSLPERAYRPYAVVVPATTLKVASLIVVLPPDETPRAVLVVVVALKIPPLIMSVA